jgi:hypothetical protein
MPFRFFEGVVFRFCFVLNKSPTISIM